MKPSVYSAWVGETKAKLKYEWGKNGRGHSSILSYAIFPLWFLEHVKRSAVITEN